ncbi:hypothetical protein AMR41_29450 [Hapalosiphon sp. MRB220]|nr:hypothetical protein AMR41_29450 [Hapalosiphon sp. MRB220]
MTFNIIGKTIIDPNGKEFIPRGFNIAGYNYTYTAQRQGTAYINGVARVIGPYPQDAIPYLQAWGVNTVRLHGDIFNPTSRGGDFRADKMAAVDEAVQAITGAGMVCILEYAHWINNQAAGGILTNNSFPTLQQVIDKGVEFANLYKNNPYVWLEPVNEPVGTITPSSSQLDAWVYMYQKFIKAIRDAGCNNIIVCNGIAWGQEGSNWNADPVITSRSAILSRGRQLLSFRDPDNSNTPIVDYKNILFGFHMYEQWGNDANGFTQEGYNNKFRDYVDRVHALDLSLFVGEFGAFNANNQTEKATQAFYTVSKEKRVGGLYWDWHGNRSSNEGLCNLQVIYNSTLGDRNIWGGYLITPTNGTKPTNLRSNPVKYNGNDFWEWNKYWTNTLALSGFTIGGSNYFGKIHTTIGFSRTFSPSTVQKISTALSNLYIPSDTASTGTTDSYSLREDSSYLLREDGSLIIRGNAPIYITLLRENGDLILREDSSLLLRQDDDN